MGESAEPSVRSLRLLGPPEILDARGPLILARRKSMALLAYIVLEERIHARDSLAALLWPECDQARSRGNLRSSLFELGRVLGEGWVSSVQDHIRFNGESLSTDVAALLAGAEPCGHGPDGGQGPDGGLCPSCLARAESAALAWSGGFMAGFTLSGCPDFDDWQFNWSIRLRESYVVLLRRLIAAYKCRSRYREADTMAERWIDVEPYNEEARRAQLELLLESGMTATAEKCFEAWERIARAELGRPPADATRALLGSPRLRPESALSLAFPALEERGRARDLIGREDELERLDADLKRPSPRLHCLTGTGGVGKTALALALLDLEKPAFPGGTCFLDLSAEKEAARLPFRLASALGMRESSDSPEGMMHLVRARIGQAPFLLVADNLEQLPGGGNWLGFLLDACRGLVVVATSRVELGVPGELVHPVGPLSFPGEFGRLTMAEVPEWPALELLILRIRRLDPSYELDRSALASCARLCARLDGIPLALELGASLMSLIGPDELVSRLDRHLGIPHSGGHRLPDRHRSLGAIIDWSYELLEPFERALYASLAVFRGDFDAEAAEAVLRGFLPREEGPGVGQGQPPVLAGLETLVKSSLLRRVGAGGRIRFSFFLTIRDHALELLEKLPWREELRDSCSAFFLARAEAAMAELRGAGQVEAIRRLEADQKNFEASLERFIRQGRLAEGRRLCRALEWAWFRSGRFGSGILCLESALAPDRDKPKPPADEAGLEGSCLRALGWLRFTQGSWHEAHARFLEALPLLEEAGDGAGIVRCLADLGVVERWLGNIVGGSARCAASIELARSLGDPGLLALALVWCHGTTGGKPATVEQGSALEEAARLSRLAGDPWLLAHAHESLGDLYRESGAPLEAIPHFELALKGFTSLEDGWMLAWTLEGYGMNDCAEGKFASARQRLRESLSRFIGLGARGDAAFVLGELGLASSLAGDRAEGDFLLGAFAALRSELGLSTLAMSFEAPGAARRKGPGQALEEASRRGTKEWREGLALGYEDLPRLLSG